MSSASAHSHVITNLQPLHEGVACCTFLKRKTLLRYEGITGKGNNHHVSTSSMIGNSSWDAACERNAFVEIAVRNIKPESSCQRLVSGAATGQTAAADNDELGIPNLEKRLGVEAVA